MTPLILDKTSDTPEVILDKTGGQFSFEGKSIPEHIKKFYDPIVNWVAAYIENPNKETKVDFKISYFNTPSSKFLFDIMELFAELPKRNEMLIINWYYYESDNDMLDAAEGFSKMLEFPFNLIILED